MPKEQLFPEIPNPSGKRSKLQKTLTLNEVPKVMYKNGLKINTENTPDAFAEYFNDKVQTIINETQIDPDVYKCKHKLSTPNEI